MAAFGRPVRIKSIVSCCPSVVNRDVKMTDWMRLSGDIGPVVEDYIEMVAGRSDLLGLATYVGLCTEMA